MDYFKSLFEQFKTFWQQTNPLSRFGIVATVLLCIGMIGAVGYWSSQTHYVTVATGVTPSKALEAVDKLDKSGIKAKLNVSATSVLADESKFSEAVALLDDILPSENISKKPPGSSWLKGPGGQANEMMRDQENRLAKTIMRLQAVEHATVNLYIAKDYRVESLQQDSTASVLVKLRPGIPATQHLGNSIVSIVVGGSKGLKPENVKVIDDSGKIISQQDTMFGNGDRVSLRRDMELYLKYKVESILMPSIGLGKAFITVSADLDLKNSKIKIKRVSPEDRAMIREKRTLRKTENGISTPGGVPGTSTNNNSGNANAQKSSGMSDETEESEVDWAFGFEEIDRSEIPNLIKRLSIAAIVDLNPEEGEDASDKMTIADVEGLIKTAIGFDDSRGDTIKVVNSKMNGDMFEVGPTEVATPVNTDFILNLVRQSSLGLGAVFAFVIGFMMIRKMKPITVKETEKQISPERAKHLTELTIVAKENPELLARIVAAWINETPTESVSSGDTPASERRAA